MGYARIAGLAAEDIDKDGYEDEYGYDEEGRSHQVQHLLRHFLFYGRGIVHSLCCIHVCVSRARSNNFLTKHKLVVFIDSILQFVYLYAQTLTANRDNTR